MQLGCNIKRKPDSNGTKPNPEHAERASDYVKVEFLDFTKKRWKLC